MVNNSVNNEQKALIKETEKHFNEKELSQSLVHV